MPAAAVIPAPIAYINVAAVKKLVVGFRAGGIGCRVSQDACFAAVLRFYSGFFYSVLSGI